MPAVQEASVSELLDQAVETFGGAVRASVKLQEDVAQWWNGAMEQMGSMQEWQRKSSAVLTDAIPTAQKAADEYMRFLDQSYHNGLDLLRKAFDSGRSETMSERQARAQDLWASSLEAARTNAQAMAQANVRVIGSWAEFLRKNVESGGAPTTKSSRSSRER